MFDDEKLAAHQDILDDHNSTRVGPCTDRGAAKTEADAAAEKTGPAPGVLQVDSAEPHVLVDGIASAVGQVVGEVGAEAWCLDLNGRPLQAQATDSTNPRVRQALERMAACREQYEL